jgi:hypothetical protein
MCSEKVEDLERELYAYREVKTIVEEKHRLGFTTMVQAREQRFKKRYFEYQHLLEYPSDQLEEQIKRLERDLEMAKTGNYFVDDEDQEEWAESND